MSSGTLHTLSALLCNKVLFHSNVKLASTRKTCLLLLLLLPWACQPLHSLSSYTSVLKSLDTSSTTHACCKVIHEHHKEVMSMLQD